MARPLRPVRCEDEIASGPSETNQLPKRLGAPTGTGPPHRFQPEPRHDTADQFTVAVLTDQDMRLQPWEGQGHHELLGMPESQDDPFVLSK